MKTKVRNKDIEIHNEIWDKYVNMHPVRTFETFQSDIYMVFSDDNFDSKDVENMILDEYNIHSNFSNIIQKAENILNE